MIIASFMILFMIIHTRIAKNAALPGNAQMIAKQTKNIISC
jgi:hypothetical protein